ncbi:hypothetical protein Gorai_006777 [Gossypium raimondii]|uniref:KIB1-4 beta-propeller domain-containing protein n=1 Tax=Gossypium raimondii TaxID=29730 RepID=A0A7J8QGB7_GOSRA|nr:hypothetical protein [Gossypium raimondii]
MVSFENNTRFADWANIEDDVLRCIADMTDSACDLPQSVDDAIYFKGNFYGCLHTGGIVLCEATHPKVVELAPPPPDLPDYISTVTYLFDLAGNLCIACRHSHSYAFTVGYDIFKLDIDTKTWEKIYSLGDRSLFLGNCSTFAIAAADYPGCKPNCIY